MAFMTDDELKSALKDSLARAAGDALKPYWDSVVASANVAAYWTIVNALMVRGYTKAQIDQWDRGAEFERAIGLWFSLEQLAAMAPDVYSQEALKALDRRKELETVVVTIGGLWIDPETTRGQVSFGPIDTTEDLFNGFDLDDSRVGELTRF